MLTTIPFFKRRSLLETVTMSSENHKSDGKIREKTHPPGGPETMPSPENPQEQVLADLADIKMQLQQVSKAAALAASNSATAAGAASAAASNAAAAADVGNLAIEAIPGLLAAQLGSDGLGMARAAAIQDHLVHSATVKTPAVITENSVPQMTQTPAAPPTLQEVLKSRGVPLDFHSDVYTAWEELRDALQRERAARSENLMWYINRPGVVDPSKPPVVKHMLPTLEIMAINLGYNVTRRRDWYGTPYMWIIELFPDSWSGVVNIPETDARSYTFETFDPGCSDR
jgi:hypothetical protein